MATMESARGLDLRSFREPGGEDDARSIEAENVGDDDELDARLEREFLQQQEAKVRLRSVREARGQLDDDEFRARGARRQDRTPAALLGEVASHVGLRNASPKERPSRGHGQGLGHGSTRFAELERVQRLNDSITARENLSEKEIDSFVPVESSRSLENVEEQEFQVPFPKKKEQASWVGPEKHAWSREKRSSSPFFPGSRTSSKVSVATSLERQYSTGSTSTVDSPHVVVQEISSCSDRPRPTREVHFSAVSRLTFAFPGWAVEWSKGENHHPSTNSHHAEAAVESGEKPPKRCRISPDDSVSQEISVGENVETIPGNGLEENVGNSRGKALEENLGDRSPAWELPHEVLLQIMRRLELRDLCSAVQTCKRWYDVGLHDDLWNQHLGDDRDRGLLSDSSSDVLPRWVCKKHLCLSESIRLRFNVFSKGYDYLRWALHEWWSGGIQNSRHSSKGIYSLMRKLTMNDWSLLYEALGVAFTDRSDRIANTLLRKLKQSGHWTGGGTSSKQSYIGENKDSNALYENSKNMFSLSGRWKSGAVREVSTEEGVLGKELWELLLKSWKRFKGWLHLVSTHCPDLNHEVMVERTSFEQRSLNWTATPTLYDKGLICFRSQIVLRYELRNVLQGGFMFLTTQDVRGCSSEHEMDLLRDSHHLLQELDVPDDFTLPVKSHTQTKLRQCFRSALLTNSKLALHMNDKLNHL